MSRRLINAYEMRDIKPSKSISCNKKTEKKNKQTKLDNFLFNMSPKSLRYNNNNKLSYSQYFGFQDAQNALRKRIYKVSRSQGNFQKTSDLTFALAFQNIPLRNIFMV